MFIDTHCHLHDLKFENTDEIVSNFIRDGVDVAIDMGVNLITSERAKMLAEKYENVYFGAGYHPSDANDLSDENLDKIKGLLAHPKCVAVGEIGLDYYWEPFDKERQIDCFIRQIELADECKLPISIHSREATEDMLKILKQYRSKLENGAVMHCFSGSKETARELLNLGLSISFAGPLTFKNGIKAREVAEYIPSEYLLTETDSPYLSPEPFRGQRNEPKNVSLVTALLAKIKGLDVEEFSSIVMKNAKSIFKKIK